MTEREDWLEKRLREERPQRHSAPDGFVEGVMARLPEPKVVVASRESGARPQFWLRFALGAIVIAIAAVIGNELYSPKKRLVTDAASYNANAESTIGTGSANENANASVLMASSVSIPKVSPEQIQALAVRLDDPLEKELKNVISDTRVAIQFVASNFLPEK